MARDMVATRLMLSRESITCKTAFTEISFLLCECHFYIFIYFITTITIITPLPHTHTHPSAHTHTYTHTHTHTFPIKMINYFTLRVARRSATVAMATAGAALLLRREWKINKQVSR